MFLAHVLTQPHSQPHSLTLFLFLLFSFPCEGSIAKHASCAGAATAIRGTHGLRAPDSRQGRRRGIQEGEMRSGINKHEKEHTYTHCLSLALTHATSTCTTTVGLTGRVFRTVQGCCCACRRCCPHVCLVLPRLQVRHACMLGHQECVFVNACELSVCLCE